MKPKTSLKLTQFQKHNFEELYGKLYLLQNDTFKQMKKAYIYEVMLLTHNRKVFYWRKERRLFLIKKKRKQKNHQKALTPTGILRLNTLRISKQRGTVKGTEFKHNSFTGCYAALSGWFQSYRSKIFKYKKLT